MKKKRDWNIFISSVFFVLGFSFVFSLLGVLLQSVLADVSYTVQQWLSRIGGGVIILFGLYMVGLIRLKFLEREHKLQVKKRFNSAWVTSFIFGAAFAVGWTPCVGAVLGAVLTLAVTNPTSSFFMLLSYSLGLGIPFLVVGLFTQESRRFIDRYSYVLKYVAKFFGALIIALGILVYTQQLSRIASFAFASEFLIGLNIGGVGSVASLNIGIAFVAGLASFLSPCVLPLIPAYLTYLASLVVKR